MRSTGSRYRVFTDEQWQRIEPLLPSNQGRRGHPFGEHRRVVEGIAYRYRTGIPWRDLPEIYGPWLSRVDLARPHGRRGHLGHGAGNTDHLQRMPKS